MAKAHPIWSNFTGGEFSPLLDGRVDLAKYFNACRKLKNMLVHPHGPASNRSGFRYIASTKSHNNKSRLIPFQFSTEQAYILEFGDQYIRFIMNYGQIIAVDSYTKFLSHFDGLDGSKSFTDSGSTGHTITAHGNAQVDTDWKKFGTGSLWLPDNGSYVSFPDHDDLNFGTGRLTIDFCLKFDSYEDKDSGFFQQRDDADNLIQFYYENWLQGAVKTYQIGFRVKSGGATLISEVAAWIQHPVGEYHIALIRGWGDDDNKWAITVNGQPIKTWTANITMPNLSTGDFEIGRYYSDGESQYHYTLGRKDEFRVSKGKARWTEPFTPPSIEYPQAQGGTPYEISSPYLEEHLPYLKFVQSADVMWLVHPKYKPRKLSRTAHTSWTLTEVDFIDGPYEVSSGEKQATLGSELVTNGDFDPDSNWNKGTGWSITGGKAVGVVGTESDIYQLISATQDEDYEVVFTLSDRTDGTITPKVGGTEGLSRNKNGTYTERITCGSGTAYIAFEKSADFAGKIDDASVKKVAYPNENNLKPSGVTGSVTITADLDTFATTDEGRLLRWQADDTNWYWFEITGYTDAKHITATVKGDDLPNTNKSSPFRLGTWCQELGYSSCVAFYEERLAFAGSNYRPQTVWLSKSGDYDNFTPGVNDDDPMTYTLAADQVNVIRWLSPGDRLMIGTVGGEWKLGSSDARDPLTPTNVRADRETTHGSADIQCARIGHVLMFLQRAAKKIRELAYSFEADSYVAPDMTLLAGHITKATVKDLVYQQEPFSILWCVRSDGALLGLTYKREQEVIAWHRHITDGNFENVAVIPGPEADELYVIVKREINGSTKRYVELLESPFDDTDTESAFFVDSGLSYNGTPTTTISGLDHLEGEEVTVLADGATHPNKTVSGNSITLDREATKVHVGLGYTSILQTMRLEPGVREGTAQGRIKRISKVVIRLYKTLGCKVGPDENTLDTIYFRDSSMPMDTPPELFTGDKEIDYPEGYETDAHITVVQDLPLPITVVAIMPRIRTAEGE